VRFFCFSSIDRSKTNIQPFRILRSRTLNFGNYVSKSKKFEKNKTVISECNFQNGVFWRILVFSDPTIRIIEGILWFFGRPSNNQGDQKTIFRLRMRITSIVVWDFSTADEGNLNRRMGWIISSTLAHILSPCLVIWWRHLTCVFHLEV
jgi:hypothetical protein